jgi:MoaA/NifB/PqqE/SkfB family radical SAM enzyme
MIVFHPDDELAWKVLEKVLPEDLFTTVHLTVTPENAAGITELIDKFNDFGVTSISLSDSGPDLDEALEAARQRAAECYIDLEWDLPVPYSARNPVALELEETEDEVEEEIFEGAGRAWLYIEPDGDVLREQGRATVLGNAMSDDWGEIWRKASRQ